MKLARALLAIAGIVLLLVAPAVAAPDAPTFDRLATLRRLADDVRTERAPFAHLALRRIWSEWDHGDPSAVEEALRSAAVDPRVEPHVRVYAGVLEAYARRRRGDLDGSKARIRGLGFVGKWAVVGPFDNEGKAGHARSFGPEDDREEPLSFGRTYDGKERHVKWRVAPDGGAYGWVNLGARMRPSQKICAYATTFVHDTRARPTARPLSLWVAAAGAVRVYWNGQEVLRDDRYRNLDLDRASAGVVLREGYNRLLVKVCGDDDDPMFTLRVGAEDGGVATDVEAMMDAAHAGSAAALRFKKGDAPLRGPRVPEGPLAQFERLAKSGDPRSLEAYARFLVLTEADDPAENKARELAGRAAQARPTPLGLLLAGDLAESRNQRAPWIDRAEDLARREGTPDDVKVKVLLARAAHARGGANFRDAVPFYDRVLALDPGNVAATLARFELYLEAGLRETALAFLERGVAGRPRSVALLRAYAAALRETDRTTEAAEIEERYISLRFDDPTLLRDKIALALARRDAAAADRWAQRLVDMGPDSASFLQTAAQAYVSLGDRAKGIAYYRRALDLSPEDTDTMRALASVYAVGGQRDDQLRLLRRVLEVQPQNKDVREYVAHAEPAKPRPDESYAVPKEEFLKGRDLPAKGQNRRTLVDLQVTTVFPNGLASRFHQVVFQPLTDAAAAQGREYAFGFESDTETVQVRGARVHRKAGGIDEAVETGDGPADNPSMVMYTSARVFYMHFPRLFPGDVVEVLYRVEDVAPRNAFADYFGEVVYMQAHEPVARAEYVLITPKSRNFFFNRPNVPSLSHTVEEKGADRVYRWVALDLAAVLPEAGEPPASEILGHVHVSTYRSWEEMGKWYWGLVKDQFVADDEVKRRVAEITKGRTDDRARVRAVYDFVVQRTRYVALEFGIHGFKPYRCAQIFARGFGDCKDKATLIVTMLKELGIQATIVIVRTGNRGDFETEPASLAPFDHAIAYVPSLDLYLDGTAEYTGSTELPAMDRGALALQINEGAPKLVRLPDAPASETVVSRRIEAILSPDGAAQMDWRADVTGASASAWRQRYHADATRRPRVQEDIAGDYPGFELSLVEANDLEDVEQPVRLRARGKAARLARKEGDTFALPVGPKEYLVREYAALSSRKRDIRLAVQNTHETEWSVGLPAGAKVTSLPRAQEGTSPFGSYRVEVDGAGPKVRVKTTIAMTKTRILANEYPAFRAFCESADRALGQRLVYTVGR